MANLASTFRGRAQITAGQTPKIYNVPVSTANTEVSQALSSSTKKFTIKVRGGSARLQLAYTATESGTNYVTISRGATYNEDLIDFSGTLYFQTDQASQTVEIVEWT